MVHADRSGAPAADIYEVIGHGYAAGRRPDPRLARALVASLGSAETVLNVGAGSGNYEPLDRWVVAAEPSTVMICQRPTRTGLVIRGRAEALAVRSRAFDACMAVSTVHHWTDLRAGLAELSRVARRRIVYFSEPTRPGMHWLVDEYLPSVLDMPINRAAPTVELVAELLGGHVEIVTFEIPADFAEASAGALWNRPEEYCNPAVQAAMSMFALIDPSVVTEGTRRLRADLSSGAWDKRHGALRTRASLDLGYRIVISAEP